MIGIIECVGTVFVAIIITLVFIVGGVVYIDNYMDHKALRHIRASKKARDEAFKYWERKKNRYTCPVCVRTGEEPSRYCPDCGTRLKTK